MNVYITPMTTNTREAILAQIAQIQLMEPGKLCIIRQGPSGPYYNLQCREDGKTVTRYVPREQLEAAQTHTANFQQFQTLVDQYVQEVATLSRGVREGPSFKKKGQTSPWSPKMKKSTN